MQIYSFSPFGYEGSLVTVEIDLRRGIPAVDIVGLADGAVKESRERMQAAIRNSGFDFPPERVLISLSPADLKKEGAGFDLPLALAVLYKNALENGDSFMDEPVLVMGELELSGNVRCVKGIHAAVSTAVEMGIRRCIVPVQNAQEAREVKGMTVYGADSLKNAFKALKEPDFFMSKSTEENLNLPSMNCVEIDGVWFSESHIGCEFEELKGQRSLIRGLQIAAAGGHNMLALGSPGCGKTMAMQKFPAINPILTVEQAQSVTRIWSLAGLVKPTEPLIRTPPFRMPHQTASIEGMCGGGVGCRPGEISLAHNGVLFLDEAAEFRSSVLQMLRVPMETGCITLSRAGRSTVYPAQFQLLMAVNPCPCGNYGSKTKMCLCSLKSVEQYWKKFSAPLLDRVEIRVFVDKETENDVENDRTGLETTAEIRKGIARAIAAQRKRQTVRNAKLLPAQVEEFCVMEDAAKIYLDDISMKYCLSPRAMAGCLKVARTIADIEGCNFIRLHHIQEAVDLRVLKNSFLGEF